jgi:hypothetical protein
LPFGPALLDSSSSRAWALISTARGLGGAMAWAWSRSAALAVYASSDIAGIVARRASCFATPPRVVSLDGSSVSPSPFPDLIEPDLSFLPLLEAQGVTPVVEDGVLRGEVLGLEVARVVDGRLLVGVGRHDRIARESAFPGADAGSELSSAVSQVVAHRRHGAPAHPANTLARSRWLRSVLVARPSLIGLTSLAPVPPPLPWTDLPSSGPAPAFGDGVLVVASVGVDPDLVPTAADARLLHGPQLPLMLVVPSGDDLPVTRALAASLTDPAQVVTVPRDWAAYG